MQKRNLLFYFKNALSLDVFGAVCVTVATVLGIYLNTVTVFIFLQMRLWRSFTLLPPAGQDFNLSNI